MANGQVRRSKFAPNALPSRKWAGSGKVADFLRKSQHSVSPKIWLFRDDRQRGKQPQEVWEPVQLLYIVAVRSRLSNPLKTAATARRVGEVRPWEGVGEGRGVGPRAPEEDRGQRRAVVPDPVPDAVRARLLDRGHAA